MAQPNFWIFFACCFVIVLVLQELLLWLWFRKLDWKNIALTAVLSAATALFISLTLGQMVLSGKILFHIMASTPGTYAKARPYLLIHLIGAAVEGALSGLLFTAKKRVQSVAFGAVASLLSWFVILILSGILYNICQMP